MFRSNGATTTEVIPALSTIKYRVIILIEFITERLGVIGFDNINRRIPSSAIPTWLCAR